MICAVVLAAGASTRMGDAGPKALLRTRAGDTFVERITSTARAGGVDVVLVVVAQPHADQIVAALPPNVSVARNPNPERGMLSSMQAGIAALPPATTAALIWPVDITGVAPETVRAIVAVPDRIVVPQTLEAGTLRRGHPVLIPKSYFPALLALDPSLGLRALIQTHITSLHLLTLDDPTILFDVDTPADLARS